MRFGSIFSGIGGFDLGFEQGGMSCAWQVEIDTSCLTVLKSHFQTEVFTDVKHVGKHNLAPVDVVCGGFPCQDVSIAGHRKGLAGKRSGLWFEMHRILTEMRPAWVVIENVTGLLHSNGGRDFATILSGLVKCGYRVAWRVLDAQYLGLAQRRKRVFLVGHLGDGRVAEVLFEPQSLSGNSQKSKKTKQTTPTIVGTLAANGGGLNRAAGQCNELDFCIPVQQKSFCLNGKQGNRFDGESETFVLNGFGSFSHASKTGASRSSGGDNSGGSEALAIDVRNLKVQPGNKSGTLQAKEGGSYSLNYQNPIISFDANRDGLTWCNNITPTLKHGGDGKKAHNAYAKISVTNREGIRRLTPVECERLQGFPDNWTNGFSDSARYRMLGNAVAVPVAQWISHRIPK